MARWQWIRRLVRPRLGVVLGGGANLGAFEVGAIDVMARRGIVPDFLVGTSVGAINAAFWALNPERAAGEKLMQMWLEVGSSVMFPDGAVPMVGRLFQRKGYLTTQAGLERVVRRSMPDNATIESARVPLAVVATEAGNGQRVLLRHGPLLPAVLASAAIPALWPPVEVDGRWLIDGSLVANCDVEAAVDAGMTDVIVIDIMGDGASNANMNVGQLLEWSLAVAARRQTELAIRAFGAGANVALLRRHSLVKPRFGSFDHTRLLFREGQEATEAFLERHLLPNGTVRPGVYEHAAELPASPTDTLPAPAMWRRLTSLS